MTLNKSISRQGFLNDRQYTWRYSLSEGNVTFSISTGYEKVILDYDEAFEMLTHLRRFNREVKALRKENDQEVEENY